MRVEVDPSARGAGLECVLDLQETFDLVAPFRFPLEGPRLAMLLQDSGLRVKNLSRIEIIGRVRPKVRDRAGHEDSVVLPPQ